MPSINDLQQEFNATIAEHHTENERRVQHQQTGNTEAEQRSMDRLTVLGRRAVRVQDEIAAQVKI